jgi:tetratricopeptide (TPR) repeat protein
MDEVNLTPGFEAYDAGNFPKAIDEWSKELKAHPDDAALNDALRDAYQLVGDYRRALPFMQRVHEHDKSEVPDHPGQWLAMSVAHWCLGERAEAIDYAYALCLGQEKRTINMAPDQALGATFPMFLYYYAVTAGDEDNIAYAVSRLEALNRKYAKHPEHYYIYPKQTLKQILGELSFEDALEGATELRDLNLALETVPRGRHKYEDLGTALFFDGVIGRARGDEAACKARMQQVFDLGWKTDTYCWQLARHEVAPVDAKLSRSS